MCGNGTEGPDAHSCFFPTDINGTPQEPHPRPELIQLLLTRRALAEQDWKEQNEATGRNITGTKKYVKLFRGQCLFANTLGGPYLKKKKTLWDCKHPWLEAGIKASK